ncbi:hypothetical protein SAMN05216431_102117 [Ligilactobacillus sp. WC1T17]|uniref:BAX inhibitor (BI)-1/YccA family protein n=1 Tax=Ligilactobacillus ruminis TaxID=1623 RepID=A0ABY1A9P2_9LACO|nr:hypothetical protein SAMN05216431_102117 [Ligilactobacillus ruminis]
MNNDPMFDKSRGLVSGTNSFFTKMYGYMACAVAVSAVVAYLAAHVPALVAIVANPIVMMILFILQMVLAFSMSALKPNQSIARSLTALMGFATIEGLFLSGIFYVYAAVDITKAFVSAAVMFAVLAVMGHTTKKDLSGIGRQALAALIALIIVSIINIFLKSTMISYVFSFIGLVIFAALTAWDTQRFKQMYYEYGTQVNPDALAITGALELYLDFINIFLYLLQIFGIGGSNNRD